MHRVITAPYMVSAPLDHSPYKGVAEKGKAYGLRHPVFGGQIFVSQQLESRPSPT
jgi:hypothetical protein